MPCAIACRTVVLPAFGGATMSARCPLPTGITMSVTLVTSACGSVSRRSLSLGYRGVRSANAGLRWPGRCPLTDSTVDTLPACAVPVTVSPRRRPLSRTSFMGIDGSSALGR
jgi:hypothetical protein